MSWKQGYMSNLRIAIKKKYFGKKSTNHAGFACLSNFRANNMYPLEIGAVRVQLTNQKEQEQEDAEIVSMKIEEIQTELEVKSSS